MLNFLRKLRRKELKSGRYLKYAIGEIILVVIGILIALTINSWNEVHKQKGKSQAYHQRIKGDLSKLNTVSEDLSNNADKILRSISRTVELLEAGELETEEDKNTVDYAMIWFSRTQYQLPELTTYEEMKGNGDLNLIYDIELRNSISDFNLYLEQVESIIDKLANAIEADFAVFNRYVRSYVNPDDLTVSSSYDFKRMAADEEFVNTFARLAFHSRGYTFFMRRVNKIGAEVDALLSTVINNNH